MELTDTSEKGLESVIVAFLVNEAGYARGVEVPLFSEDELPEPDEEIDAGGELCVEDETETEE
jgi:hypothetical protein